MTGRFVAFFAVSFVRSYPGDRPAFSRAGNFGFSARFYRRPGPALFSVGPALRAGASRVNTTDKTTLFSGRKEMGPKPETSRRYVRYTEPRRTGTAL
jgi:hypothetical protein